MKKRTCYGCRALVYDTRWSKCELRYPIKMKHNNITITLPTPIPVNTECPKPRTYSELFRLLDEKDRGGKQCTKKQLRT